MEVRLRNGRWITGFGHEWWPDFSFFVTLVSIVLGGTESLVRNSTRYRVVRPWRNMEHGTYLGTMQPGRRCCYPDHEFWCMKMNRTWHIMGVKFLGCDSHRVVALVSFVFGRFSQRFNLGGMNRGIKFH